MGCTQSSPSRSASTSAPAHPSNRPSVSIAATSQHQHQSRTVASSYPPARTDTAELTANAPHISRSSVTPATTRQPVNTGLRAPLPFSSAQSPPPVSPNQLSRSVTATSTSSTTGPTTSQKWTRTQLDHERKVFFETRVTGHKEIWQAIQLSVDMVRESGDWRSAGGVLDAAGCSVGFVEALAAVEESGRRRRRRDRDAAQDIYVWDERGQEYRCPVWVWADPSDIVEDLGNKVEAAGHERDPEATDAEYEVEDDGEGFDIGDKEFDGTKEQRAGMEKEKEKDKGKDKLAIREGEAVDVRVRFSDRGTDIVLQVDRNWQVKHIARRIIEVGNLPSKTKIKVVYLGRFMQETQTLEEQGWRMGHVLNVFVFEF